MPTIDVTAFVQNHDMYDFAHSEAEHCGAPGTAGRDTWKAALDLARLAQTPSKASTAGDHEVLAACRLVTDANEDEVIDWLAGFGAWSREELELPGETSHERQAHLCALLYQFVAGWAREMIDAAEGDCGAFDKAAYMAYMEDNGGNLWCEDPTDADAKWTLYVGI